MYISRYLVNKFQCRYGWYSMGLTLLLSSLSTRNLSAFGIFISCMTPFSSLPIKKKKADVLGLSLKQIVIRPGFKNARDANY